MLQLPDLSTEILFWGITGLALTLTIIFWNTLSKKKVRYIVGRISVLLFIQIFALVSVGVTVNRAGEFYSSWGDLFGSKNDLAKIALSSSALALISPSDIKKATRTAGGSLIFREVITGEQSGISDVVYLVLSPKLATILQSDIASPSIGRDYQVIELFPGYPGVPQTWIGTMQGIKTLERLEAAGEMRPTVAVIPAINVAPGKDTECLNLLGGPEVETWLTTDMRTFARKFVGVDARLWSTFGYSTGGWCATMVAIRHPDMYANAVSLAGYFKPLMSLTTSKPEKARLLNEYNLIRTLSSSDLKPRLMVISSNTDKFTAVSAKNFIAAARSLIDIRYVPIPTGGHNTKVWVPFVSTGFLWINAH